MLRPEPYRVLSVCGGKIQDINKKCSENLIEYFSDSKNGVANCVSTQKIFNDFKFWDKRIVVHNKRFIKISGILLLIVKFVKSSDLAIIQIIRNKSNDFSNFVFK